MRRNKFCCAMNRATFFKSLLTGIIAAPAVVKILAEEPSPFTWRKVNEWQPAPLGWRPNPAWETAEYHVSFAMSPKTFQNFSGSPQKLMWHIAEGIHLK